MRLKNFWFSNELLLLQMFDDYIFKDIWDKKRMGNIKIFGYSIPGIN